MTNVTSKPVRGSIAMVSRDVVALWLGLDPIDIIDWRVDPGALVVAYRDEERGLLTPEGAHFPIVRSLSVRVTRDIEER